MSLKYFLYVSSAMRMRQIGLKGGEKRMMRRAIITVKAKVQKVRYRSKVKGIADELGIVGEVENLKDGSVRIYAESEEEVLNEFITKLKLKNPFD